MYNFQNEFKCFYNGRIDWNMVYKKYSGIAFLNYSTIKKEVYDDDFFKFAWFFGIDVNSVCVWNNEILEIVKKEYIVK